MPQPLGNVAANVASGGAFGSTGVQNAKSETTKPSLFERLDTNKDGVISGQELKDGGYTGDKLDAMSEAVFFTSRNIDKWFKLDQDKNGKADNIEAAWWGEFQDSNNKIGDMTLDEYAASRGLIKTDEIRDDLQRWNTFWLFSENPMVGIISGVKNMFPGVEFTDDEIQLLKDVQMHQANSQMFKGRSCYQRLNVNAYSVLFNLGEPGGCCNGNQCLTELMDEALKPDLPNGAQSRALVQKRFESAGNYMTDQQKQDVKNLIEKITGQPLYPNTGGLAFLDDAFNSSEYMSSDEFRRLVNAINGTDENPHILTGKTREDALKAAPELLKYLEANGMLLPQFAE